MDAAPHTVLEEAPVLSEQRLVEQWLGRFDVALQSESRTSLAQLFAAASHYRDLVAFTWTITPECGPEDIAAAVCFLASNEAAYITGQVVAVNGGMYR